MNEPLQNRKTPVIGFLKKYGWLFASIMVGVVGGMAAGQSDVLFEHGKNLEILAEVYKDVNELYVDGTEPTKLMKKGIKGMCAELDPYTVLLAEDEISKFRFSTTGKYGGIGAQLLAYENKVFLADVTKDQCGEKAGLMAGDELVSVDGVSVENRTIEEITKMINGSPGTAVAISIKNPGSTTIISKNIIREEVKESSVPYHGMITSDIGYVVLTSFTDKCGQEVADAVTQLKKDNPNLKGLILDLRNNGGGLLNEAVNVSNIFLPKGTTIVNTRGKLAESTHTYPTLNNPIDTEIPVAVLTNKMSASASEIVSGCLQDLDRAAVVGQKSYGKGLVQITRPLTFGNQLKVTTAKYYTPSGRCIQVLDYSHRNEDGSVGKVPDSLKHVFMTKRGRKVFDGGGIEPDVPVAVNEPGPLAKILLDKNILFAAAVNYRATHSSLAGDAKTFAISDADFELAAAFMASQKYDFISPSEKVAEQLKTIALKEKYFDKFSDDYKQLKDKLNHGKKSDIMQNKQEISRLLSKEIVAIYKSLPGKTEFSFTNDQEVVQAVKLLEDKNKWSALLNRN